MKKNIALILSFVLVISLTTAIASSTPDRERFPLPNLKPIDDTYKDWTDPDIRESVEKAIEIGYYLTESDSEILQEILPNYSRVYHNSDRMWQFDQPSSEADILERDELLEFLSKAYEEVTSIYARASLFNMQAHMASFNGNRDNAIEFIERAYVLFDIDDENWKQLLIEDPILNRKHIENVVSTFVTLSLIYERAGEPVKAVECYYAAFAIYNDAELPILKRDLEYRLGFALLAAQGRRSGEGDQSLSDMVIKDANDLGVDISAYK